MAAHVYGVAGQSGRSAPQACTCWRSLPQGPTRWPQHMTPEPVLAGSPSRICSQPHLFTIRNTVTPWMTSYGTLRIFHAGRPDGENFKISRIQLDSKGCYLYIILLCFCVTLHNIVMLCYIIFLHYIIYYIFILYYIILCFTLHYIILF